MSPKWPLVVLTSSSMESLLYLLEEVFLPLALRSLGHGNRNKKFASESLGLIVSRATPISIPGFLDQYILAMG